MSGASEIFFNIFGDSQQIDRKWLRTLFEGSRDIDEKSRAERAYTFLIKKNSKM